MSDLRLVLSVCAIQELEDATSDLSNGYLQTVNETKNLFIDLAKEIQEFLSDEWQALIKKACDRDIELGGSGRCVFPAVKNLYGESYAGTSFVFQYQRGFENAGWTRAKTSPALFYKRCPVSGKLQLLVSYVDDIAAALSKEDDDPLWENLRNQGWIFSETGKLDKFIGIQVTRVNSRQFHLDQQAYLEQVVEKFEQMNKKQFPNGIRARRTLPTEPPEPNEEINEVEGARTHIGGFAYAARGTHPGICRAVNALASCANRWSEKASVFCKELMEYCKGTSHLRLNIDARGMPRHLEEFNVCAWGDGDYRAPKCHAGALISLRPFWQAEVIDDLTNTLPWDWSCSTNRYSKLNTTESEMVALGLVARAAIEHSTIMVELITGGVDYMLSVGHERLGEVEYESYEMVYVYEDNIPCRLACERGWSSKLMSMPRTYGISLCWIYERIQQGLLKLVDQRTSFMIADVFTKLIKPTVLIDAGIIVELEEVQNTCKEKGSNSSMKTLSAVFNSSAKVKVDYRDQKDGNVEVKLTIPKELLADPKVMKALAGSFGLNAYDGPVTAQGPTVKVATD
jgi:hypothetical protein